MSLRCRPAWMIVALGLTVAACGASEPDRIGLRTPGAKTGHVPAAPLATPAPTATATPEPKRVTRAEERVIRGWSDALRHGRVAAASRYFSVPSAVSNLGPGWMLLETQSDVETFNAGLPCGAKLLETRRSDQQGFVVGIFRLTERPGRGTCGTGTGAKAAVAFSIQRRHITRWVRADSEVAKPTPAPTATATPAEPTPTATASPDSPDSA